MEILHFKDLGDTKVSSTNAVWVLIQSLTILLCSFRYFTSVSHLKAIGPLLMEIVHFEDFGGYKCHLAANTVVLVPGEYQISIAKYLKGVSLPTYKI